MKTLGRIFIILLATALVTPALNLLVSASNTGAPSGFP